ncbi:MAG: CHAT domain-containing tetratricopeptide repeat protein [Candidatus Zixiibacteriota bacterium]
MDTSAREKAVRRFLTSGKITDIADTDLAAACEQLIQAASRRSFKRGLRLADRFLSRARVHGGPLRSTALRAVARMNHFSGNHSAARKYYLLARKEAGADPLVRGRIDRTLVDVYMYLNDFGRSAGHARSAMATFTRLRADSDLAQTWVNYGNLLHRQDRHRLAERWYRKAATYFDKTDNQVALARCLYNRANVLVQMFEFSDAEELYCRARSIYEKAGYELDACDVRYGLAWLWMLSGRFHQALLELSACETTYHHGGDPRGETLCTLDRAEVYLTLGLYEDARKDAASAGRRFAKLNLRYERAKAALFQAQAAQSLGWSAEASRRLQQARAWFRAERNEGFSGVAHLVAADVADTSIRAVRSHLKSAQRLFARARMPFWEAVCDLRRVSSNFEGSEALSRLRANKAAQQVPHLFALGRTLDGDHRWQLGDMPGAQRLWREAANRLDDVRAQLPPVELRNAYSRRQSSPHLRLIASEADRDPLTAAVWSERYKTTGLWSPLPGATSPAERERIGQSLSELAAQVTAAARHVSQSKGERGWRPAGSNHAVSKLQRQIREQFTSASTVSLSSTDSAEMIAEQFKSVSHQLPIIQFHLQGDDIFAFVHRSGATTVTRFDGGRLRLGQALEQWRFILERQLLSPQSGKTTSIDFELSLWQNIGEWLWRPLEIDRNSQELLILPEGELANLPWGALICDCEPLVSSHHVTLSPSLRHYLAASRVQAVGTTVDVFRGAADNLPMVDKEIAMLVDRAGSRAAVHDPGRRDQWPVSGDAEVWHYSGHAQVREDNPFYSYLILEDGPFFAADFRLRRCRVNLVTLAACRSGEEVTLPGEESTGLVRSLLEMGARNVVAGHWPVADESTASWMQTFYDTYFSGEPVLVSARRAALAVRERFPSAYHWAAFSVFGASDIGGHDV